MDFRERIALLFAGRDDVYAEGFPKDSNPNKYEYFPVRAPLTPDALQQHLDGERQLGVYPIRGNKVKWFAIDFDAPKGADGLAIADAFPVAYAEAVTQALALERAGLNVYLERSRSGQGVHVWGFLTDWVDARIVRDAIRPHIAESVTYDRIFPVQDEVADGKLGNLIALPFNGAAVERGNAIFVDHALGGAELSLDEFFAMVRPNYPAVIEELAANAPKRPRQRTDADPARAIASADRPLGDAAFEGRPSTPITGVLKLISEYGCRFMHHAWVDRRKLTQTEWWIALSQLTCFENGRAAAHAISRDYPRYSPAKTDAKFDQLMQHPPHGCAYIHEHAPQWACHACPMKAPYHVAKKTILELVQESSAPMRKAKFGKHIDRIRRRNSGDEKAGVPLGIDGLDRVVLLRDSELIVIGAMPSMGKTAFMVHSAVSIARTGVPALVFSAETAEGGLFDRFIAHEARIDSKALRGERFVNGTDDVVDPLTESEYERIRAATQRLEAMPLYVNFTDINADQVLGNIERVVLENDIPLDSPYVVFFDYLQFGAKLDSESNYERVSRLSTEFKNIAKITKHPVLIFSQLTRASEDMEVPTITMFKESGRIEQDADVAGIIGGDRMQGKKAPRRITIVKQREGESQIGIDLVLHQDICHFVAPSATRGATTLTNETPSGELFEIVSDGVFGERGRDT